MINERPILTVLVAILVIAALLAIFWNPLFGTDAEDKGGWKDVDGQRYYELAHGGYAADWTRIDGQTYYFDKQNGCAMATGWLELDGKTYYLGTSGAMVTGWQTVEDKTYYFSADGVMATGWLTLEDGKYYLSETGAMQNGWLEQDGERYYLDENGRCATGWKDIDGKRYHLGDDGTMSTGWLQDEENRYYLSASGEMVTGWVEENGNRYYLQADGTTAKGKLVLSDKTYYFTSTGAEVLLVNRWNPVPKNYAPEELVACKYNTSFNCKMVPEAVTALDQMIGACKEAGFSPLVRTGYRSYSYQQMLLDNKMNKGYSYEEAIKSVAVPGTSEHQTGLAVDISDSSYTNLNREQGSLPIQKWLKEHCHEFGFIVRYPDDTTHLTGIIYESWHYRYVGVELATELYELDICLEEYLDRLTGDGTTCGDPNFAK